MAFVFGVLTEVSALMMITVAGIPYILWSGFKIGSDTQGIEEIILATLAIVFIYDIDESVYNHILPELYKEAHERDKFEITGAWISSSTHAILNSIEVKPNHDEKLVANRRKAFQSRVKKGCPPLFWNEHENEPIIQGDVPLLFAELIRIEMLRPLLLLRCNMSKESSIISQIPDCKLISFFALQNRRRTNGFGLSWRISMKK
jgi:hypothetical protein